MLCVLSGMSTLDQVKDNIATMSALKPFDDAERSALDLAVKAYRESIPIPESEIRKYEGFRWNGVPVTSLLQEYNICRIQPNPGFSDDNNYAKNAVAEEAHLDFIGQDLPVEHIILPDGTDGTETVKAAISWLKEHSF